MESATLSSGVHVLAAFNCSDGALKVLQIQDPALTLPDGLSMSSTAREILARHPDVDYICVHGYASIFKVSPGIRIAFFPWQDEIPGPDSKPAWIEIRREALESKTELAARQEN